MTEDTNDNFTSELSFEPEPVAPYDPGDASGKRAMVLLGLTFGGLLALALLVFNLYQPGTRDRDAAPLITADNQPFKVEPSDAGGAQTPNQDREVFNRIDGTGTDVVETAPIPEAPVNLAEELPTAVEVNVEPVIPQGAVPRPEPVAPTPAPEPTPAPVAVVTTPRPEPVSQSASNAPVAGGASDYVVQVASLRSEAEAQDIWNRMSSKYNTLMPSSAYADIQRADLGDKGIYFRVRVAGLADKSAANQLCSALKAQGQACFPTRR